MANDFILEGKLLKKFDVQQITATFSKRSFVVEIPGTYIQYVQLDLKQDKCNIIDPYNVGESLMVHFNLEGREWQGRYFTNLTAWKIERVGQAAKSSPATQQTISNAPVASDDDLPF